MQHLGVVTSANELMKIYCNNQAAIAYTKDPKYHSKIQHIDIKYNYMKDMVSQNEVILQYIPTH